VNYYEHHLGDYAKDTLHLSMLEHGAYRLLLDRYYATEKGIPADQAHRLARARTRDEREAVDAVLAEFFVLTDGVWCNRRADEEVAKAQARIGTAQANGKKGGRPKKNPTETQEKPSGFLVGSESETQAKAHQAPDTKHQESASHSACEPSAYGLASKAMRQAGMADASPSHPDLIALVDAGVTLTEFADAAAEAVRRRKGFVYALATVRGRREDAARKGPVPAAPEPEPDRRFAGAV